MKELIGIAKKNTMRVFAEEAKAEAAESVITAPIEEDVVRRINAIADGTFSGLNPSIVDFRNSKDVAAVLDHPQEYAHDCTECFRHATGRGITLAEAAECTAKLSYVLNDDYDIGDLFGVVSGHDGVLCEAGSDVLSSDAIINGLLVEKCYNEILHSIELCDDALDESAAKANKQVLRKRLPKLIALAPATKKDAA